MSNHNPLGQALQRIAYLAATLFVLGVLIFLVVGIREARRARLLRNDICKLEPGKSTFADVRRIFAKYTGYVQTHDDVPASCSAVGCFYVLYVENPIPKVIPIFPRIGLFAKVLISEDLLNGRSLSLIGAKGQRYREAFVQQSAKSHFSEGTRIIIESKMPRKGAAVSSENSERFVELANELKLSCLVTPGVCSEEDDMLPFLKDKTGSPRLTP